MAAKLPPPPKFTGPEWQAFNRWLVELTSILSSSGDIDPGSIPGYNALAQDVANLNNTTGNQGAAITAMQTQIVALTLALATANASITTLASRAQVFNGALGAGVPSNAIGADSDWFYNRTGAAGNRLFIKLAGAWVAQAI